MADDERITVEQNGSSTKQSAYELFHRSLLAGEIRPGEMLAQRQLVDTLNISLGTLREVLPKLEAEGLISVKPQRGILITSIDLKMIKNAYQMRVALEREAVTNAVRDEAIEPFILEQRAIHQQILDRCSSNFTPELVQDAQDVDDGFHRQLIFRTNNDLLISAYGINSIRIRMINIDRQRLNKNIIPSAFGEHLKIIEAILDKDLSAAIKHLEEHVDRARSRVLAL